MEKQPQKKRPEFIFFERYDLKTTFGFDDFQNKIPEISISAEILNFRLSGVDFFRAGTDALEKQCPAGDGSGQAFFSDETAILSEIASLNSGITLKIFSGNIDESASSITFIRTKNSNTENLRFLGSINGRKKEMIEGILLGAADPEKMFREDFMAFSKTDGESLELKCFVSQTCPSCPPAAVFCGVLALLSDRVKTFIIDVSDFSSEASRFGVIGLPRVVVNDQASFMADAGPGKLLRDIMHAEYDQ